MAPGTRCGSPGFSRALWESPSLCLQGFLEGKPFNQGDGRVCGMGKRVGWRMALQGRIKNLKQLQILWVILGLSCGNGGGVPMEPVGLGQGSLGREEGRGGLLEPSTRGTSAFNQC